MLALGGSPYYLVAGVAILVAAWDLFAGRPRGFVIFSGVLLMTLVWAVYESGTGFWTVGSRIWIIGPYGTVAVFANDSSPSVAAIHQTY